MIKDRFGPGWRAELIQGKEVMSDNFEREIPKTRISISVDSHVGASARTELPLKLLVLGDFSAGRAIESLAERKKIDVNKTNFDAVLGKLNPQIIVELASKNEDENRASSVMLNFRTMDDFEPDHVAEQIPELQRLLAMRILLSDFKVKCLGNDTFRNQLELILKNPSLVSSLKAGLRPDCPGRET
ncbi:type VI secretion system contractile sheath small subunit [Burkholderia sp. Leaf177]|uniref:type VI secretion system contractile sheath small subunit n=1 Tax=Burkholderia sp. Leaf177 TaxID=1736287 RepID=UPI0019105BCE|nr:type VI secretion system contractile sheath small subunit [Burkholderia sp. Leaf177]